MNIEEILKNISSTGSADESKAIVKHLIGKNLNHVLNTSSGSARIQTNVIKRFILITSQPAMLFSFNPFEIRCSLCKSVISYPCWYYGIKYTVNHFHYFVCFNGSSAVNVSCFRG